MWEDYDTNFDVQLYLQTYVEFCPDRCFALEELHNLYMCSELKAAQKFVVVYLPSFKHLTKATVYM